MDDIIIDMGDGNDNLDTVDTIILNLIFTTCLLLSMYFNYNAIAYDDNIFMSIAITLIYVDVVNRYYPRVRLIRWILFIIYYLYSTLAILCSDIHVRAQDLTIYCLIIIPIMIMIISDQ
jgi:multisubunit Na+/H+ antiporter MnhE subunit